MKYSQEEITNALTMIKEICESQKNGCYSCPFGSDENMCKIMNESPTWWNIEGKGAWRAFE